MIFTSWPQKGGTLVGQLHVLDSLGNQLFAVDLPGAFGGPSWNGALGAPTIANIDSDPDKEIVVGTVTSGVVAYDLANTAAVYAPATGAFFLKNANGVGSADLVFGFGPASTTPLAGDWDGDGVDTVGVNVAATGVWFLRNTNTPGPADLAFAYGPGGAMPVVGNWDGM